MAKTFQADALRTQVAAIIAAAGSQPEEARTVAAEPGAGQPERPRFARRRHGAALRRCGARRRPQAQRQRQGQPRRRRVLALDGQRGYGQVVGEQAMALGMARAKELGSCILSLANAHHLGRIGHFAEMAVAHGLVSIHFVNVQSRPVVAPWGGSRRALRHQPLLHRRPAARAAPLSCWTSRPAASHRARCASPTTRAARSSPAT